MIVLLGAVAGVIKSHEVSIIIFYVGISKFVIPAQAGIQTTLHSLIPE
jgi:hypothetical protein